MGEIKYCVLAYLSCSHNRLIAAIRCGNLQITEITLVTRIEWIYEEECYREAKENALQPHIESRIHTEILCQRYTERLKEDWHLSL
ncbi:hypothetical protein Cfor_02434 [Coptotermes formosanus]|uniref:Uncharacterized protein n=1 Tax=Coptotermes formosanus TaxID=36987 RepID=A0A6L2PMA0_COPFO|nr:hypothetical protein Cfor_02434 [Coptotermes formosanus]